MTIIFWSGYEYTMINKRKVEQDVLGKKTIDRKKKGQCNSIYSQAEERHQVRLWSLIFLGFETYLQTYMPSIIKRSYSTRSMQH